jgi:hypothetical protein
MSLSQYFYRPAKVLIFFVISFLTTFLTFGQSALPKTVEDSLRNDFFNPNLADTLRMKAMDDLAWDGYLYTLPDSAYYYADLLYAFAEKVNDVAFMINAINTKGNARLCRAIIPIS